MGGTTMRGSSSGGGRAVGSGWRRLVTPPAARVRYDYEGVDKPAAEKMMANMGWKEGQGLGRDKQGIATPLIAKKIAGGQARIELGGV